MSTRSTHFARSRSLQLDGGNSNQSLHQTEMVSLSQPIPDHNRATDPVQSSANLEEYPFITNPVQDFCGSIIGALRNEADDMKTRCTIDEMNAIEPVCHYQFYVSVCQYKLHHILTMTQSEECKLECCWALYPILSSKKGTKREVEDILMEHGISWSKYREWFSRRGHKECLNWVRNNTSVDELARIVSSSANDAQDETNVTSQDAMKSIVQNGLMEDWMVIVKAHKFCTVLSHFNSPYVD